MTILYRNRKSAYCIILKKKEVTQGYAIVETNSSWWQTFAHGQLKILVFVKTLGTANLDFTALKPVGFQ